MSGGARRAARSSEAGLTLLELLVSLALLGLLFTVLQGGFALGQRVWERATTRLAARIDAVEAAQVFLRDRIARANPAYGRLAGGRVSFEGDQSRLTFDAPPPDAVGAGTYLRYTLAVGQEGELELLWKPDTHGSPLAPLNRSSILPGVAGLELGYFGARGGDPEARWHDTWRQQPRPPDLVRIRLSFPPGDGRIWPDLLVTPWATVDAGCVWVPTVRACEGRL